MWVSLSRFLGSQLECNQKTTYLGHRILGAAHGQDPLDGTPGVVADSALGAGHTTNLGHVLTSLSNDCRSLGAGDHGTDVDPARLVLRGVGVGLGASPLAVRSGRLDRLSLGMTLAIGGIGNNGVALDILGVLLGGRDLVGGHLGLGLGVGVAACYFVESRALGLRLVIWARGGRRVLERTLG